MPRKPTASSSVLSIRVPAELDRRLAAAAKRRRQSRSEVARELLEAALMSGGSVADPAVEASDCIDAPLFRVALPPGARTGLEAPSQVMADKVVSVPRAAIARVIGKCDDTEMGIVDDALRHWLAL